MSVVAATKTEKAQPNVFVRLIRNVSIVIGALVAVGLIGAGINWMSKPSEEQKAEEFGSACYEEARAQFKNPDAAILSDTGVTVVDDSGNDTNFKLEGTGSGVNGFGGYSTVTWSCVGFYSETSDRAYASATVVND